MRFRKVIIKFHISLLNEEAICKTSSHHAQEPMVVTLCNLTGLMVVAVADNVQKCTSPAKPFKGNPEKGEQSPTTTHSGGKEIKYVNILLTCWSPSTSGHDFLQDSNQQHCTKKKAQTSIARMSIPWAIQSFSIYAV